MKNALVVVEIVSGQLSKASESALAIATNSRLPVAALLTTPITSDFHRLLQNAGADRIIAPHEHIESLDSQRIAQAIRNAMHEFHEVSLLLAPPSIGLRDAFGRLCIRLKSPIISSLNGVSQETDGTWILTTSIDGGRRRAVVHSQSGAVLLGIVDPEPQSSRLTKPTEAKLSLLPPVPPNPRVQYSSSTTEAPSEEPLASAKIVIAGGRGMGTPKAMRKLHAWAKMLPAAFGAARAPVESGWVSFDRLIGQTGTTIAPELYVAFGISGAPQHLSGIRSAKRVIAVNIDEASPIAKECDVLICEDGESILSELMSETTDRK